MKRIKLLCFLLITLVYFTACEVERFPHDQIEQTQSFRTMTDAATINNGMYAQLRNRVYGMFMYTADVQVDLFNATAAFGNRNGNPHRWEPFLSSDYTLRDTWSSYYSALSNVNNIIENMNRVETQNEAEEALIETYIGEAYLIRAFYYHKLVSRWGMPYNAATASQDLGVPLVLTFNPSLKPSRATVQQVYDQIISDIQDAKQRLSNGDAMSTRATRDAALALESRVKLYMKDWNGAINAAQELIGSGRYSLASNEVEMLNLWVNDSGKEIIFHVFSARPNELPTGAAVNNIYLGFLPSSGKYTPDFVPLQWVIDMFEDGDLRKDVYLQPKPLRVDGFDYDDIYLMTKYRGNPELFVSNTNYQHKPIVFRLGEVYLNLIEAQFHTDGPSALNNLNALREARGLEPLAGVTGNDLWEAIMSERTRELLGEGFRLDDLQRWGLGFSRTEPQNDNFIVLGETFNELAIPAGHPKFVWGIPINDITTNRNMVQNPGW